MKQTLVVGIALLFFIVGMAIAPAYAKETVLARRSRTVTKQESLSDVIPRLSEEAIEEAKKHPCVQKAFDAGREDFKAGIRTALANGVVTVTIVTEENCD